MRKEYKYSNLKQETNTSGIVMLEPSKKIKKRKPGVKPPKVSNRQILEQILKRLDKVEDVLQRHSEILERHSEILQRHSEILERHSEILERHDQIFKRNNLK